MARLIYATLACVVATVAFAQTPPAKDRKDFLIEAVRSQRDHAQADAAACYADANGMIDKLRAEIMELKAQKKDDAKSDAPAVK